MAQIKFPEDVKEWLKDKPPAWSATIALRAALRVLPFFVSLTSKQRNDYLLESMGTVFRALVISAGAATYPSDSISVASDAAHDAYEAAFKVEQNDDMSGNTAKAAASAADAACGVYAAKHPGARGVRAPARTSEAAFFAVNAAANAAAEFHEFDTFWESISTDIEILETRNKENSAQNLLSQPLWPRTPTPWTKIVLPSLLSSLRALNVDSTLWFDWYDRRLAGNTTLFNLPLDADIEIIRRIFVQKDYWWRRDPKLVNGDIQTWIDELTPTDWNKQSADPDPQEATAPQFTLSSDNKITLDRTAGQEDIRKDQASINRHIVLRAALSSLASDMRGHNNAGHFAPIADSLIAALGDTIQAIEPSLTVLHAETLRQAFTIQQAAGPNDNLMPLAEMQLLNATTAINAVNLFIGSDPYLDAMDRVMAGPDRQGALANPEIIQVLANAALADDVADDLAVNALLEAADHVTAPSQSNSRQVGFLSGMALNFVRYGIELIFTYPAEMLAVTAGGSVASAVTLGIVATAKIAGASGAFVMSTYGLARYFKANADQWREITSMSPTTSTNFERLLKMIEPVPTASLKDH